MLLLFPALYSQNEPVPFCYHLGIHLLVPLTYRLVFVEIVQPNHRRCVPMVIVALRDNTLGLGCQEGFDYVLWVHAASSHRLALDLF